MVKGVFSFCIDGEGQVIVPKPSAHELEEAIQYCTFYFRLEAGLIRAIVDQESGGNVKARRYEEAFYRRYIQDQPKENLRGYWPHNISNATERHERSTSWGAMQIMGQTARERGFRGDFPDLLQPSAGVYWGCLEFNRLLQKHNGNIQAALLSYNGGGNKNYPAEVMARIK